MRFSAAHHIRKSAPYCIDTVKKAKIHALINDLARRDALVHAGKMQFLNFCDVKNYMGTKWIYVEPIIVSITQDVISKYTEETDISFRYSEDEFIIIFAKASPQEAELKCQLISAEIQRLLFEETEKNEKLKDLKINLTQVSIRANKLNESGDPLTMLLPAKILKDFNISGGVLLAAPVPKWRIATGN